MTDEERELLVLVATCVLQMLWRDPVTDADRARLAELADHIETQGSDA